MVEERMARPLNVALLGAGTVGSEVARLLWGQADDLEQRIGAPLRLVGVAVRDASRPRPGIPAELLTDDAQALVTRGDIDVVVEVVGGIEPVRSLLLAAMEHGASVVTANKALLAEDGATLYAAAEKHGVDIFYEASVAGAIPLLRPLRESLAGDRVQRVLGIVNGTTNYILSQMETTGASFDAALAEAQALGYAEADPTADVEGHDAAAKAAILAGLAFHSRVTTADVPCEGIASVTADHVAAAAALGHVVKLLAIAETDPDRRGISVRVHPAMIPATHPLANVRDAFNAVFVEAESAGQLMFYGRGAGGAPTASAVLGDLVAAARNRASGAAGGRWAAYAALPVRPAGEAITRYWISLDVADRPGVLAGVAGVIADHGVSLETVRQTPDTDGAATLTVVTHRASEAQLRATVEALRAMPTTRGVLGVMRVEGAQ
jgi:homoserine dehydrogenase